MAAGVQVASIGRLPRLGKSLQIAMYLSKLGKHVLRYDWNGWLPECTLRFDALKCAECLVCCLMDGGGMTGNAMSAGASSGDPVNLATGEEEYRPAADLTVYNPHGPSVQWTRLYDSLRAENRQTYESEDYGLGWSQGYNVGIRNTNAVPATQDSHVFPGSTSPITYSYNALGGYYGVDVWTVFMGGTTVASNTAPNGWNMTFTTDAQGATHYSVTVPAGAATGAYTWYYNHPSPGVHYDGGTLYVQPRVPSAGTKAVFLANGSSVSFTAPSVPTAGTPRVICTPQAGAPFLAEWDYDSNNAWGHFVIAWRDRTKWVTTSADGISQYVLHQIVDRNGNAITFGYIAPYSVTGTGQTGQPYTYVYENFPLLSTITDASTGTTLLTVNRSASGWGAITSISDCYGRSVVYASSFAGPGYVPTYSLMHVSQIVPTGTSGPSDRYAFGYYYYTDDQNNSEPVLHTITVPSASGPAPGTASLSVNEAGTSTATINYAGNGSGFVSSLVDGNGNTRTYANCNADGTASNTPTNYTKVTVTDKNGNVASSYIGGVDMYMSAKSITDGVGNVVMRKTFSDPNDPYRPSSVTDGNGNTTQMTWDQYANMLTETPPTNGTRTPAGTTYTYKYASFALGELIQMQEGSKSPTRYTYYEPSGLVASIQGPLPGSPGTANSTPTTYTYDLTTYDGSGNITHQGLGNLLTVTTPGNNAAQTITTTFSYTSDGSYSQTAAIGQPLTVTDNLGKVSHLRYDSRGNCLSVADAISSWFPDQYDFTYNIADQPLQTICPAANQQGSGRTTQTSAYLYPGGPVTGVTTTDETGAAIRQVNYAYGQEGETLGVSGSTEPVTYAYDALYRLSTLADGNGHATHYYYKLQGYLDAVTYPGYAGPVPAYNSATDDYSNITGKDSVRYPAYDANGNLLVRIDGNGVETDYTHNADPQSLLTLIHYVYPSGYAGGTTGDVSLAYDAYGRRAGMTDGTGSQSYAYDDNNDLLSDTTTYANLPAQSISYSYWPNGSRQTMTAPIGSYSYTYDGVGRLTGMTNPYGQAAAWDYLDNGWLFHQTLSNAGAAAVVTSCYYTQRGQLTSINNRRSDNSTLSDYTGMSYDGAGNRTSWTGNIPAATSWNRTDSYAYDAKNQLTQEASTGPLSYTGNFGYDPSGNATTLSNQGHAYNANNQDTANTYDGNGNPVGYGGQSVRFDPENRLTQVGSVLSCGYNGDGQRAWKQNSAGARTYFLYDGSQPVCELNGSGTLVAVNDFGADGVWARHTTTSDWFYTFDPQGSASQKIGRDGSVLCSSIYDAQGHEATTDTHPDPFSSKA